MAHDLPAPGEPDRGASEWSPDAEPRPAAEPRAVHSESARALIYKQANDRRTLDRALARMRPQ